MTGVRGPDSSYVGDYDSHLPSVRVRSRVRYTPNQELTAAIGEVVNETGKAALGRRALHLFSRTYEFTSTFDAQRFSADYIMPRIEPSSAILARVAFTGVSTWEEQRTERGNIYRVYLHPLQPQADSLGNIAVAYQKFQASQELHRQMQENPGMPEAERRQLRQFANIAVPTDPHTRMLSRTLSFAIPKVLADMDIDAANDRFDETLNGRLALNKPLYADQAQQIDKT